jgi:hypothetical protein
VIAAALALLCYPIAGMAQNPTITITVDTTANRHPIDPNVYGVAHATTAQLSDLNTPLNRNGGNNTTRYNWQLNADNRGNDWYYESIGDSSATPGERGDTFVANARSASAQAMLTIPLVDWVAKVGANRSKLAGFSIAKYGAQTGNDWQWFPDAGNGVRTNGQFVPGNDPNDANVPSSSSFQQDWVRHLVGRWGTNATGGLRYYILDNEPSLWHSTHRDVRPTGATMDDIKNRMVDFASKIKAVDSSALVVGPEEWGWSGYFYSGFDQQYGSAYGWVSLPDRNNHGGADYLTWLLGQLRQSSASSGQRLLDVFTVHYYPQGGEFSDDVSSALFGATTGVGLLSVFGMVALGLASLGLYGTMAHAVRQRQREIGLRMALGAQRFAVLGLVFRQGLTIVGIGMVFGLALSALVGMALSGFLFGVGAVDPISVVAASAVLALAAAAACYVPARRASRLDPVVALREG